jgi:hypothetical protein
MSLRLVKAVAETESMDDFHLGRLLVLLRSSDLQRGTPETKAKAVEGIMKLAKLDFLLRYPTCLERALAYVSKDPSAAEVQPRERTSIESKMIRFRYGPWDPRYRRWLGLLTARGLVQLRVSGNTVQIGLTDPGRSLADLFRDDPLYDDVKRRSDVIAKTFGRLSATKLKNFVYDVVPEITNLKWGDEITTDSV